ncbi:multidrug efflux MFS transporter [Gulosibacter chungangensis]|uniref:Multidrug efflux MFS transporter n=1 Tax=Gulosibacter chungangensis TaxID=979746 RepID=A0A7J5B7B4_9MICO|nr:MDR family MFS transporter [Gulosibacter chungangensis]KAB1640707.1 multidrug efflux MFS transporter [Gulosibacter chungangensis]
MRTPNGANTPKSEGLPAGAARVIWLLIVAAFVAILNETTMAIAIPHLNADLGIPPELGQWFTSAFMLTMAVVIPTTGYILQRFTTRQVFLAAMIAFAIGTLVCLIAPGFTVLLTGRVIQAAGTGVMMPLLMTTLMSVVPASQRGRWMGMVSMVISLAPALGPSLSGLVLDTLHWRWLFGIVLPIALISLVIGAKWMTNLGETSTAPFDVPSVALSALAFGGIVFGLSQFGADTTDAPAGALSPVLLGSVVTGCGAVFLALFVWRQLVLQRTDRALLDLRTFKSRNFSIAVITMTIIAIAMFGTLTLLPLYLQNVAGLDALQSGLVLMPGSLLMGLLGPLMGVIYDRKGPRALLVPGTIMIAAALSVYSTVGESTPVLLLIVVQAVMSVGLAMSFTPLFSASLGSLPMKLYSHGSASLNTMQQVGGAMGVAVLIAVYSSILHGGEAAGLSTAAAGAPGARLAFLIAAGISLVPVVLAWFVRRPADQEEPSASAR